MGNTNLNIDEDLKKEAKLQGLNLSAIAEKAIIEMLGQSVTSKESKCNYCGVEMRKATVDDLDGLVWLCPDERWCCPKCEKFEMKKVLIGVPA